MKIGKDKNMASSKEYLQFILEQLSDLEEINYRAMMKEYIIARTMSSNLTKKSKPSNLSTD